MSKTKVKTASDLINDAYDQQINAKNASIDATANQNIAAAQQKINNLGQTYDPQRNNAYTSNMNSQRTLRENMANLGLSGGGGTSLTQQNTLAGSLRNTLAGIDTNQQNDVNNLNTNIANYQSQANVDKTQAAADLNNQRQTALNAQAWNEQNLAASQKQNNIQNYLSLFLGKRMTPGEFYKKTGIKLKG